MLWYPWSIDSLVSNVLFYLFEKITRLQNGFTIKANQVISDWAGFGESPVILLRVSLHKHFDSNHLFLLRCLVSLTFERTLDASCVLNLLESSNTNRDLEWLCVIITSFSIKRELLRVISNLIYKTLPAKCLWPHIQTSFLWNKVFEVTDFMNLASRRPVGVRWCERVTFWSRG